MNKWGMALLGLALLVGPKAAPAAGEMEALKIRFLIASIEGMPQARFVRNGLTYDAKTAAAHLRKKWEKAGQQVVTAEDFIRVCASRSWVSGEPYKIRFPEEYFRKRLQAFQG